METPHAASLVTLSLRALVQARQSLEKAKMVLDEEKQSLSTELKSLQASRTESDRGRKRAESQLQELTMRLTQADQEREEREERVHKLQVGRADAAGRRRTGRLTHGVVVTSVALLLSRSRMRLSRCPAMCPPLTANPSVCRKKSTVWRASFMTHR